MTDPSAFALDLFGFDVYTFPPGAAGAMSFHDPLEGTETSSFLIRRSTLLLLFAQQERTGEMYGQVPYLWCRNTAR